MPVGEFIAEFFLHTFLEVIVAGLAYATGAVFLKVVTAGQLALAPLDSRGESSRRSKGSRDWSLWLERPGKRRSLKADWVCLIGFIVWVALGLVAYHVTKEPPSPPVSSETEDAKSW